MGLIPGAIRQAAGMLLGDRNVVAETVELFRENAEKSGAREATLSAAALAQFAAEFGGPKPGRFDRFMDGVNRIPRPALALGTLGLFVAAMVDPAWFAERMRGIALVPEPLWWLLGAIVSFYFGARHQSKGQDFQRAVAETLARAPAAIPSPSPATATRAPAPARDGARDPRRNWALDDWRAERGQ